MGTEIIFACFSISDSRLRPVKVLFSLHGVICDWYVWYPRTDNIDLTSSLRCPKVRDDSCSMLGGIHFMFNGKAFVLSF